MEIIHRCIFWFFNFPDNSAFLQVSQVHFLPPDNVDRTCSRGSCTLCPSLRRILIGNIVKSWHDIMLTGCTFRKVTVWWRKQADPKVFFTAQHVRSLHNWSLAEKWLCINYKIKTIRDSLRQGFVFPRLRTFLNVYQFISRMECLFSGSSFCEVSCDTVYSKAEHQKLLVNGHWVVVVHFRLCDRFLNELPIVTWHSKLRIAVVLWRHTVCMSIVWC